MRGLRDWVVCSADLAWPGLTPSPGLCCLLSHFCRPHLIIYDDHDGGVPMAFSTLPPAEFMTVSETLSMPAGGQVAHLIRSVPVGRAMASRNGQEKLPS